MAGVAHSDSKVVFLAKIKDLLGSKLVAAYSLRKSLLLVLADEGFVDSLKELNGVWLELGSPEQEIWPMAIKMSELPVIMEYGVEWNAFLSAELMEPGSLIYGQDVLKVGEDGLLKARLMMCNQWGASYEGLPGLILIEPTDTAEGMREGLIKDMKLLLQIRHQVPPEDELGIVNAFLKKYEDMPEGLKSDLRQMVQSSATVESRRAHFICLLYQEHMARILLKGQNEVKDG